MATRDAYCFINDLDTSTVEGLIARLEFRGKDPTFTQMRDAYLAQLALPPTAHILELGCGTGVVLRALAQRTGFSERGSSGCPTGRQCSDFRWRFCFARVCSS